MFNPSQEDVRRFFCSTYAKAKAGQSLEAIEIIVIRQRQGACQGKAAGAQHGKELVGLGNRCQCQQRRACRCCPAFAAARLQLFGEAAWHLDLQPMALEPFASLAGWQDNPHLAAETRAVEAELAGAGRVLIRASGTEPVLRVMVESRDAAQGRALAERLVAASRR